MASFPVVEIDGTRAICDGGGGALGHPILYIQLDTKNPNEPVVCKYCGTRYIMKGHLNSKRSAAGAN